MALIAKMRNFISRRLVMRLNRFIYGRLMGMDLGEGVRISMKARLDRTNPAGVHVGDFTYLTAGATILSHDFVNREWKHTHVGRCCFLGYDVIVLPGVRIGDHCIIGSGSIVTKDIPSHSVAVGSPARVVESGIKTDKWGIRLDRGDDRPVID